MSRAALTLRSRSKKDLRTGQYFRPRKLGNHPGGPADHDAARATHDPMPAWRRTAGGRFSGLAEAAVAAPAALLLPVLPAQLQAHRRRAAQAQEEATSRRQLLYTAASTVRLAI